MNVTEQMVAELPPLHKLTVKALLGGLSPADRARVDAALAHVVACKARGDPRPFLAILRDYLNEHTSEAT